MKRGDIVVVDLPLVAVTGGRRRKTLGRRIDVQVATEVGRDLGA